MPFVLFVTSRINGKCNTVTCFWKIYCTFGCNLQINSTMCTNGSEFGVLPDVTILSHYRDCTVETAVMVHHDARILLIFHSTIIYNKYL